MFQVIKATEVPDYHKGGRAWKYPFPELDIGTMFFVPHRSANTLMSLASKTGRKLGRRFETRLLWMRLIDDVWKPCPQGVTGAVQGIGVYRTK